MALKLKPEDLPQYTDKGGNVRFEEDVIFDGYLDCRGNLNCEGEHAVVNGTLFWSHASMPNLPEKRFVRLVMPQAWQRAHYRERLGFELHGCYKEIREKVGRQVFALLKNEKWLPIERWMLECIRDYEKDAPQWVLDLGNKEVEPCKQ